MSISGTQTVLIFILVSVFTHPSLTIDQGKCDQTCQPGSFKVNITGNINCTSMCKPCLKDSITNDTDLTSCMKCQPKEVSNPARTKCQVYGISVYSLARPAGILTLICLSVMAFVLLMAFIVLVKNKNHQLVLMCGYHGLILFLIGCAIVLLSSVPLLAKPSVGGCSVFIGLFSIGLTIIFAVLISRSGFANSFYDENNEIVKRGCGQRPRLHLILLVVSIQLLFLIIGLSAMKPETMELATETWHIRYLECSNWASLVFWVAFAYNVVLSLVGNFLSCSSTDMDERCQELRHVLLSYLMFYVMALLHIILLFRVVNEQLAEGQAILCVLYALGFFLCYIAPKIYIIMYYTKEDGVTIQPERLLHDHEHQESHGTSLIHAKDGYKHHIVGMKVKSVA
ncbi:G-protein coupled receptor family C group 6 member A-like [Clytia hemisphaerica]|uniref:G-protein coupled receptor family C group 6 member A-like n=1 Tax=Clytia hemisphaerica TaxID=252671 RepID=UPI0034D6CF16